jgi:hypothetical protein
MFLVCLESGERLGPGGTWSAGHLHANSLARGFAVRLHLDPLWARLAPALRAAISVLLALYLGARRGQV